MKVKSLSPVRLLVTMDCSPPGSSAHGIFQARVLEWGGIALGSCICVCAQLRLTLCDPMNCSPPSSSVHRISQARTLEWVTMPSSRGSSWPRDQIHISSIFGIADRFFTTEALWKSQMSAGRGQSHLLYYQDCFIPNINVIPGDFVYPNLK